MATQPKKSKSSRRTASSTPPAAAEPQPPAAADRLEGFLQLPGEAPAAWSGFDAAWYVARHGLAERLGGATWEAARAHYLTEGQAAALSPNLLFDEAWYRLSYAEVAAGIAAGVWRSGFEHYCIEGHADRSPHWLFDHALYRDRNPDLTDAALRAGGWFNLYDHMIRAGGAEGRPPHLLFDPAFHAARAAGDPAMSELGPFRHFLLQPSEPRPSWLFDPDWYRTQAAIPGGALHHYLVNPTPAAFDPLPDFSEAFYLQGNPDVAALVAAGVYRNGYDHYLRHGALAGLSPGPHLDLGAYLSAHPAIGARVAAGDLPHGFVHAVGDGARQGLRGAAGIAEDPGALLQAARCRTGLAFPEAPAPLLTVIVTLPPRPERALSTLACLQGCAPAGTQILALVCPDDYDAAAALLPGVRLMACGETGRAAARSHLFTAATGTLVLLLDAGAALPPDSLAAALRRMEDPSIGAVGGPILDRDGRLLGAGGIVCANGGRVGYLRGEPACASAAGFLRDVDYCSGAMLLLRRDLVLALGGLPAEAGDLDACDADLCLRIWQSGHRVAYDPRVALVHPDPRGLRALARPDLSMPGASPDAAPKGAPNGASAAALLARHPAYLRRRLPWPLTSPNTARTPRQSLDSVLLLADSIAAAEPRDLVRLLSGAGADVTVVPLDGGPAAASLLPRDLPDDVEVVTGVGEAGLEDFLSARPGCFSRVEFMTPALADRLAERVRI